MYRQLGNKTIVLRKVLDIIEYIDQEQNSLDMYPYKQMLLRMSGAIMNGLSNDQIKEEINTPEKPEEVNCGGCDCGDSQECAIPMMQPQTETKERIIPEFNLQDTIEKIKGELDASKN